MSESVDTRVVEAKFDSEQFEKGVDKTVKKLDELKKSLNLKDAGDSIAELADKTQKASTKASESLEKLETRFTSFAGMLKQKFISGIADEIVGVFFRIKNSFEGLVHSLSSAQVSYGMQRYNDILTSVRTLVSAGETQDASYNVIERLGTYADQTSYSLDALVSTMSKFKTSGASLSTAQRMVEGLSNAAASMGVNAQDAQRAYLNLQQAYSKGAMMQNDWISFESIPMVGTKFNQRIIDAAIAVGTLEVDKKNGGYKTKGGKGSEVKTKGADATGITAENMGTKLSSRWFNKAVMERVFGEDYYFSIVDVKKVNQIKDVEREYKEQLDQNIITQEEYNAKMDEYFEKLKNEQLADKQKEFNEGQEELNKQLKDGSITQEQYTKQMEELRKEFDEFNKGIHIDRFSWEAFRAGQEARSLTDVLNTLKDTISRGWAQSFEYIFGKLDDAAEFFTKLTESNLAEGIYAIGEFRNEILRQWNESGGRDNMLNLLEKLDNAFGSILKKIGLIQYSADELFEQNFNQDLYNELERNEGFQSAEYYKNQVRAAAEAQAEESPWEALASDIATRLTIISRDIGIFMANVSDFFKDKIEPIFEKIRILGDAFKTSFGLVGKFTTNTFNTLIPLINTLFGALDKISKPLFDLLNPKSSVGSKAYDDVDNVLTNINKVVNVLVEPLSKISEILADVIGFIVEMGTSTVTSNLSFISDTIGFVLEVLGIGSSQQEKGESVLDGIVKSVQDLGNACKDAFGAVNDFFSEVLNGLRNFLRIKDKDGNIPEGGLFERIEKFFETNEFVKSAKDSFNKALEDIGAFIKDLPNRITKIVSDIDGFFHGILYTKDQNGNEVKTALNEWLTNAGQAIWSFITVDIPNFVKNIPNLLTKFFDNLFYTGVTTTKLLPGGKVEIKREQTALKNWLDNAVKTVKNFITKTLPQKIKEMPSIVSEFFKGLLYTTKKDKNGNIIKDTRTDKEILFHTDLKIFLDNIVSGISNFIYEFIQNLPSYINTGIDAIGGFIRGIVSALFGTGNTQEAGQEIQNELERPFQNISLTGIIDSIKIIGRTILNNIISIFTGSTDWETNKNSLAEGVAKAISWISEKAESAWNTAKAFFISLPGKISGFFSGTPEEGSENGEKTVTDSISKFVNSIGSAISSIPNDLLTFWKNTEKEAGKLWNTIVSYITGEKQVGSFSEDEYNNRIADMLRRGYSPDIAKSQAELYKKNALGDIAYNIDSFFHNLVEYISEKVSNFPENLVNGINTGASILGSALETIMKLFEKEDTVDKAKDLIDDPAKKTENGFLVAITQLGTTLYDLITVTLPGFISKGFTFVSGKISELLTSIGIFKPDDTKKAVEEEAQKSFIDVIVEKIKSLPEALKNAFDWVNKHLAGFDDEFYKGLLQNDPVGASEYAKYYNNKNPIVEFFSNMISGIGKLFESAGPVILDGLKTAISWIGGKLGDITKWLNTLHGENKSLVDIFKEDYIDPETHQKSGLWEGIKSFGETIKNLLVETIPGFIKAAVDELQLLIPQILGGLFGKKEDKNPEYEKVYSDMLRRGYSPEIAKDQAERHINELTKSTKKQTKELKNAEKAAEKAVEEYEFVYASMGIGPNYPNTFSIDADNQNQSSKKNWWESLPEGLVSFTDGISELFSGIGKLAESFGTSELGKWAVLGLVISLVANSVRDILTLDDELDAVARAARWGAIKTAILGLIAIVGWFSYLGEQTKKDSNGLTQLDRTIDALNRFAESLKTILIPIGAIIGALTVKSVIDWRKSAKDAEAAKATAGESAGFLGSLLGNLSETLLAPIKGALTSVGVGLSASFLGEMGEMISGNIEGAMTSLGGGFEALSNHLSTIVTNLESVSGKVETAKSTVISLRDLMSELIGLMYVQYSNVEIPVGDEEPEILSEATDLASVTTETSQIIKSLPAQDAIDPLTTMINKLSGSISLFKEAVTNYGQDMTSVVTALSDILNLKDKMIEFAQFTNDEQGTFEMFKSALASIGGILQLYSVSFSDNLGSPIETLDVERTVAFLKELFGNNELQKLIQTFDAELMPEDKETLETAERITIFAGALSSIAAACLKLTGEEDSSIQKLFDVVSGIKVPENGEDDITTLSQQFGELGNALAAFAVDTSGLSDTQISVAQSAISMLLDLAQGLSSATVKSTFLEKLFTGDKSLSAFGSEIEQFGTHLAAFLKAIDNLGEYGTSITHNRKNLSMALMATKEFANTLVIMSNIKYTDPFKRTFEGGFSKYIGDLTGLGTSIMKFVDEVDAYSSNDKQYNFDFVNNALNAMSNLVKAIINTPDYFTSSGLDKRVENFKQVIFGDGNRTGLLSYLSEFFAVVISVAGAHKDEINLNFASTLLSSFSEMTTSILNLYTEVNKEVNSTLEPHTLVNPMEYLIPTFEQINNKYHVISKFIDNAKTLDKEGLKNAADLFYALHNLASTLNIFSQKDASTSNYKVLEGLNNLMEFNWEDLRSVTDAINEVFGEDLLKPKIEPELFISEEFKQQAKALRAMIDPYANAGTFDQSTYDYIQSLDSDRKRELAMTSYMEGRNNEGAYTAPQEIAIRLAQDQVELIKPINYINNFTNVIEKLNSLQNTTADLGRSIASMQFVVDGKRFAELLGPYIDVELGTTGYYATRGNVNDGGWYMGR